MSVPLVLAAEDDAFLRVQVEEELTSAGFDVRLVASGKLAMEQLQLNGSEFGALLTDIRMGAGPDGWEVARRARELHPTIPVVYMTGDSAADWSAYGVPNSVMLSKPFAPAQLITAVSQLINAGISQ